MPLTIWDKPSGYNFGTFNERTTLSLLLTSLPVSDVQFKLISGKLPPGLRVQNNYIKGTPFEVARTTEYKFVIRAFTETEISDRTFFITIDGGDEPKWITPEGLLPVGTNQAYYVIDSTFIDFQLDISDTDTAAGQKLSFFIASGEGELPPGLRLLSNGRITGFVQPLLAAPRKGDTGYYDAGLYDTSGYDFGYRPTNGFDSYLFDLVTYDFSVDVLRPRKLNRNYEFVATVTDGDNIAKRKFRIYVVGDDFFSADNVIMQAGHGTYTADVTYLQIPIFTTPKYLGMRRANNYQTFKIDIYEGLGVPLNPVIYELAAVNSIISGVCEKELNNDNMLGSNTIRFVKASDVPKVGYKTNFNLEFQGATNTTYTVTNVDSLGSNVYRITLDKNLDATIPTMTPIYLGTSSEIPSGMQFDISTGEVFGSVPYQPAITKTYNFTIKAIRFGTGTETNISRRMFTVDILGEVDSNINWISNSNLGIINTGYPSDLFVKANTTYKNSLIYYKVESGSLPPGLTLSLDGEIVGKVNQPKNQNVYKSFWKSGTNYDNKSIVKRDRKFEIQSLSRRKNIATLVTKTIHNLENNDIVKIYSDQLNYNEYQGIEIAITTANIISTPSIEQIQISNQENSYYFVTFNISAQLTTLLYPIFTSVSGVGSSTEGFEYIEVDVKSTSGSGTGAKFLIKKASNYDNYSNSINTTFTPIKVVDPGVGYLPGDKITISGSNFPGGVDEINDLTFKLNNGLNFYYKVNGNSNSKFNGTFISSASTSGTNSTITLLYTENPGNFGVGLISEQISINEFTAHTQITPLNYFYYTNINNNQLIVNTTGNVEGTALFYKSKINNNISLTFNESNWELYKFTDVEKVITNYDGLTTTFDDKETTNDRKFEFTVIASDQLAFTAIKNTFSIEIDIPLNSYFSNIVAKPFLKQSQRDMFKEFINDVTVFNPMMIYRLSDPNFGIQKSLTTLIYAGLETKKTIDYLSAMGRNHKQKRFKFGEVKKAIAKNINSNEIIYEVVYVELIDPLEKNNKHLPFRIKTSPSNIFITADNTNEFYNGDPNTDSQFWRRANPFYASIDRIDVIAGDSGSGDKFPSSISIWRKRLRAIANIKTERNFLPLWMRTIQPGTYVELDFIPAVTLCYCKPGGADRILLNIKQSGFDFKSLDYTIDRYIIDSVEESNQDKYLIFKNDRTTI